MASAALPISHRVATGTLREGCVRHASVCMLLSGLYRVWRNSLVFDCVRKRGVYVSDNGLRLESYNECFRIGPRSRCFCGHSLTSHLQKKDDRESAQQLLLKELQPRSTDTHNGISPTAPMYRASSAAATRGERTGVAAGGKKPHHPRKLVGVDSCSECSCRSFAYIPSEPSLPSPQLGF